MKREKFVFIVLSFITTYVVIRQLTEKSIKKNKQKILCMILATNQTLPDRGVAIWETWGKECDKTLFACNCSNNNELVTSSSLPVLQLDIVEGYNRMGVKVLTLLKTVYRKYLEEFDFFLLTDDDTYIFVENLRKFSSMIRKDEPLTYGYNFKMIFKNGYHSGGAGVLFTRESLRRMGANIEKGVCAITNKTDGFGDIAIGLCSELSNVTMGNSLDEQDRERFHPLSISTHYLDKNQNEDYPQNKPKSGEECCSEESISFHYVSVNEMYNIYELMKGNPKTSKLYKYI